jgi:hypothetical protein
MPRSTALFVLVLGCGGDDATLLDAAGAIDATVIDAGDVDAAADAPRDGGPGVPLAGFGTISGTCGVVTPAELDGTTAQWWSGALDFMMDRYDDPAERPLLTAGGVEIILDGNAGGSSLYSEVFAYEWLARCEGATLLKTETEIVYDVVGKKADLLVEIDGRKVGVSVVRFVQFPFGTDYQLTTALPLVQRKIEDLRLATAQVSAADRWTAQMVVALAYNAQHAQVAMQAWSMLDPMVRGSTLFVTVVSDGDDLFIYTDQ